MINFTDAMRNLNEFQQLNEAYCDYRPCEVNEIRWRDPETQAEREIATKKKNATAILCLIVSLVFTGAAFAAAFSGGNSVIAVIFMFALALLTIVVTVKMITSPVKVTTGYAVRKRASYKNGKLHSAEVSFVPASGEPEIYRSIKPERSDYNMVTEDTPLLVVKTLGSGIACIFEENTELY